MVVRFWRVIGKAIETENALGSSNPGENVLK